MKFKWKGKEYYIDGFLSSQLDSILYNVKKDWDFVLFITGDRTVRGGKSILGMTVCAYLAKGLADMGLNKDAYTDKDIYFDNIDMMKAAFTKPKYSINHYDEGREGLAASKAVKSMGQDLVDFFAECGQLNHIFVIVAPDFFKLNEEIAVARSEFLINVYRKEVAHEVDLYKTGKKVAVTKLQRGFFEFFSRKKKQNLYDKAKTTGRKNYGLIKADFVGRFVNQYPIAEDIYRKMKKDALSRFSEKKEKEKEAGVSKKEGRLRRYLYAVCSHLGLRKVDLVKISKDNGYGVNTIYNQFLKADQEVRTEREAMLEAKKKEIDTIKKEEGVDTSNFVETDNRNPKVPINID